MKKFVYNYLHKARLILAKKKIKIAFTDSNEIPAGVFASLSKYAEILKLNLDHSSNRSELKRQIKDITVLWVALGQQIDSDLLQACPALTDIVSVTTGLTHIDTQYLAKKQIRLHCLRGEKRFLEQLTATAEHTWGLILNLQRHIHLSYQDVIGGNWTRDGFKGRELQDKTLGIIGLGRLGKKVASYANVFGMNVIGYDPNPLEIPDYITQVSSLERVLKESHIVSLHVHATLENQNLISKKLLNLLRPESYLINTARGEIIDEIALVNMLNERKIAGYAADVVANETSAYLTPLQKYAQTAPDNLLLTPHLGGYTYESRSKAETFMAQKYVRHILSL